MTRRRAAAVFLLLVLGVLWLDRRPIVLPGAGPSGQDTIPLRESAHPVLLLVDLPSLDSAPSGIPNSDLEWENILTQMLGGCDVRQIGVITQQPELLSRRQIVVLPRAALAALDPVGIDILDPLVEAGLEVWLETPPDAWSRPFGLLPLEEDERSPLAWPFRESGFGMDRPILPSPASPLPISHRAVRVRPLRGERGSVISAASPAGRPLLWQVSQGRGAWRIFTVHLAALSSTLRQGRSEGGRLIRRESTEGGTPLQTSDLVRAAELLRSDVPWLDAWLEAMVVRAPGSSPLPTLWPAPPDADGWLLVGEGEHDLGRDPIGIPTTTYLEARDPAASIPALDSRELGLRGLLPTHGPLVPRDRLGLGRIRPLARLHSLALQRQSFDSPDLDALPLVARIGDSRWTTGVDDAWRGLTGAEFRADSSFGPGAGAAGWLFGSGAAFRPLSQRGQSWRIWEVPFHWSGGAEELDPRRLRRWMQQNQLGGHGPLHLYFPPGCDASTAERLGALARETGHHLATLSQYVDFWEARAATRVRWSFHDVAGLRIEVEPGSSFPAEGMAIAIPTSWQNRALLGWDATWSGATARRVESFGRPLLLVRLSPRPGAVTVRYQPR